MSLLRQQQLEHKTVVISMAILSWSIGKEGKRKGFEIDHMDRDLWLPDEQFSQKNFAWKLFFLASNLGPS